MFGSRDIGAAHTNPITRDVKFAQTSAPVLHLGEFLFRFFINGEQSIELPMAADELHSGDSWFHLKNDKQKWRVHIFATRASFGLRVSKKCKDCVRLSSIHGREVKYNGRDW